MNILNRYLGTSANIKRFEPTVLLPRTDFPMKASACINEIKYRKRTTADLWAWQKSRKTRDEYILHDGPPYANGDLHMGHALNKILKDIILRYQILAGRRVDFRPGWDCHGLPIELKASEALSKEDKKLKRTPEQIRKTAREFALATIDSQRKQFKSWGIMGEWDKPYRTLDASYEANQMSVFGEMHGRGLIHRKHKPVYWSPWTQTALAEAELEYVEDHKSRSAFVKMELCSGSGDLRFDGVEAVIWTTTPWTLPANRAICVNPQLEYSIVQDTADSSRKYLLAKECAGVLKKLFPSSDFRSMCTVKGEDLTHLKYRHPLYPSVIAPVIGGDHVTDDSGTGVVHTAPGHGFDDYEVTRSHPSIEVVCPVNERGQFTADAGPQLDGLGIFTDGTDAVLEMLGDRLVLEEQFIHKYPYDWRTRKPIIIRATEQWFADVSKIKQDAIQALDNVDFIPRIAAKRLRTHVETRNEWCISRQRSWGVPIPAFYHKQTNEALMTGETISHFVELCREHGAGCWWDMTVDQLLPSKLKEQSADYDKGSDTMDVWFDSGTSWKTLPNDRQADLYLEGSDQHRGWFQSSLLTSVAARGIAPYKAVLTHGFVMDEHGRKMSKSLGNVIEPSFVTNDDRNPRTKKMNLGYGVDVLRMWISSTEYTRDVSVGQNILKSVAESLRKIRNSTRFILGNLQDFDPSRIIEYDHLNAVDRYMLVKLHDLQSTCQESYANHEFSKTYSSLIHFCNTDLSAFYFEIIKHSLFNHAQTSHERRSSQTVLFHILKSMMVTISPIAPHFAEEVFEYYKQIDPSIPRDTFSVFQLGWQYPANEWKDDELSCEWTQLRELRSHVNTAIENLRQEKVIGSSMHANCEIELTKSSCLLEKYRDDLAKIFITSKCEINVKDTQTESVIVGNDIVLNNINVFKSLDFKCPRCRGYFSHAEDHLCTLCEPIVESFIKNEKEEASS